MSQYLVQQPCVVSNSNGSVTVHSEPGAVIELSDEQAAELGDSVRALGQPAAEPQEEQQPARSARGRGRRQQPADEERGAVVSPFDSPPEEAPGDE